jgi:hypothetical protein
MKNVPSLLEEIVIFDYHKPKQLNNAKEKKQLIRRHVCMHAKRY